MCGRGQFGVCIRKLASVSTGFGRQPSANVRRGSTSHCQQQCQELANFCNYLGQKTSTKMNYNLATKEIKSRTTSERRQLKTGRGSTALSLAVP